MASNRHIGTRGAGELHGAVTRSGIGHDHLVDRQRLAGE
jgi:hypothetical protein